MKNAWLWNKFFLFGFLFLGSAILAFAYGIFKGEVQAGIILIFPFLMGSGIFSLLGTIFLMLAIFCFVLGFISGASSFSNLAVKEDYKEYSQIYSKTDTNVDGIVLIGPFPVVFSTKKSHILYLAILAFLLAIGILLLVLFFRFF